MSCNSLCIDAVKILCICPIGGEEAGHLVCCMKALPPYRYKYISLGSDTECKLIYPLCPLLFTT